MSGGTVKPDVGSFFLAFTLSFVRPRRDASKLQRAEPRSCYRIVRARAADCSGGRASRQEANLGQRIAISQPASTPAEKGSSVSRTQGSPFAAPIAALSTPWGPRTPCGAKRPTQADRAVDAVNIGRRVGRATLKRGGRVFSGRRNPSSRGLATGFPLVEPPGALQDRAGPGVMVAPSEALARIFATGRENGPL
jgi:hypothetical protein